MTAHVVPDSCRDETCRFDGCSAAATHKVGEKFDDGNPVHDSLAAYVCCRHFRAIFGKAASCPTTEHANAPEASMTRVQRRLNFAAQVCKERGWTLGALTPLQLKELRRLQDAEPPSGSIPVHLPGPGKDH